MSDEKHLSGEERRKKMKESYKKDIQNRKDFLQKVKKLKESEKIRKALEGMSFTDDTDEWISQLDQETAMSEARAEIALESVEEEKEQIQQLQDEVELQKLAAKRLVMEMKKELGLLTEEEEEETPAAEEEKEDESPAVEKQEAEDSVAEESSEEDADEESSPAKTMGDF